VKWISLSEAIVHVGGDHERIRPSLLTGDVKARMRHRSGRVFQLDPKIWRDWDGTQIRIPITGTTNGSVVDTNAVEIDQETMLEHFGAVAVRNAEPAEGRAPQAAPPKHSFSSAKVEKWFRDEYIPELIRSGRQPSRDEMVDEVRAKFDRQIPAKAVYELRKAHAPADMTRPGRRTSPGRGKSGEN
jgi:hypothetical protein